MALKWLFLVCCYLPRWSCIFVFFCPAPSFSFSLLSLTHTVDSDPAVCVISFLASVSSLLKLPDGCLSALEFRWFPGLKASPPSLFLFLLNLFQSASPSHTPAVSSTPASCSGNPTDAFSPVVFKAICLLQDILNYIYLSLVCFIIIVWIAAVLSLIDLYLWGTSFYIKRQKTSR